MKFGYVPQDHPLEDLAWRVLGWPNVTRRLQAPIIMRMLDVGPGCRVLDVGCAMGCFTSEIARLGADAVGLDRRLYPSIAARISGSQLSFVEADATNGLPFAASSFDRVLLSSVLQMLPVSATSRMLEECRRVIRPSGRLVLTVPVLPPSDLLRRRYGVRDDAPGWFSLRTLGEQLRATGWRVREGRFSPTHFGARVYRGVFLYPSFYAPYLYPVLFAAAYPLARLHQALSKCRSGTEVVCLCTAGEV